MNQGQIARQIKKLLSERVWTLGLSTPGTDPVFGSVVVTAKEAIDVLRHLKRMPLAIVRLGPETSELEFPEIIAESVIVVQIITRVSGDALAERAAIGGPRPSFTGSGGAGLAQVVPEARAALERLGLSTGVEHIGSLTGSAGFIQLGAESYSAQSFSVSARAQVAPFYHPARLFTQSGNVLSWTLPPDRFDRPPSTAFPGLSAVALRYAAGAIPPASVTDGLGATLSGATPTSYTHGDDGQGAGTFSYSLFGCYDDNQNGVADFYSAAVTLTGTFT